VALGQVFLLILRFFPVCIVPPLLHIHSCIIWGRTMGPLAAAVPFRQSHRIATGEKNPLFSLAL
jgi:hypothetical protein